ncbi:hypothetical protein B0H10DRAFT_1962297 [Mycena sp. CBHHK59/15]|nr:hypothetical protein B0H10DRAFT_1962297 [Mycena sp. CBHHK59/15]
MTTAASTLRCRPPPPPDSPSTTTRPPHLHAFSSALHLPLQLQTPAGSTSSPFEARLPCRPISLSPPSALDLLTTMDPLQAQLTCQPASSLRLDYHVSLGRLHTVHLRRNETRRWAKAKNKPSTSTTLLVSIVPSYQVNYHAGGTAGQSESHYYVSGTLSGSVPKMPHPGSNAPLATPSAEEAEGASLPFPDSVPIVDEDVGAVPVYADTPACDENGAKTRQTVTHLSELKGHEALFLQMLLSLHYRLQLLTPCACGKNSHVRTVCWLDKHRTMPTHWPLIWNTKDKFFEKHDFCRVMKSTAVAIGHDGHRCPEADPMRSFTLVDSNGIHATCVTFCRCQTPDGQRGYTLGLLEYFCQQRSQGKGSASNFLLVLQCMADPFFAGQVPDIYDNFLAITRWHQHLDIVLRRGQANGVEVPLPGEPNRPYLNHPLGYLGLNCAACLERGVNMPLVAHVPRYLRHLISNHNSLDGNFKMNMFHKRNDGNDHALTDGRMYFPKQTKYDHIAATFVVKDQDKVVQVVRSDCLIADDIVKEVPCNVDTGSIRHQGSVKYGNTAISGVVACTCDHTVVGSFIEMLKGEV